MNLTKTRGCDENSQKLETILKKLLFDFDIASRLGYRSLSSHRNQNYLLPRKPIC